MFDNVNVVLTKVTYVKVSLYYNFLPIFCPIILTVDGKNNPYFSRSLVTQLLCCCARKASVTTPRRLSRSHISRFYREYNNSYLGLYEKKLFKPR